MAKYKVVHYLNQFFGQLGAEEAAAVGFSVKEGPVGPGVALQAQLGDDFEIVATVICGDDYFGDDTDKNAAEGLALVKKYNPDVFFAGPAFAAGRYSVACGAMCKAVQDELGIPCVSSMDESGPGMDMYRKEVYITKGSNNSRTMVPNVTDMAKLAKYLLEDKAGKETRLISLEYLPDPVEYNYFTRDLLRNAKIDKSMAERAVEKMVQKLNGEPFVTEVVPERLEVIEPPKAIKDMSKATIAFVSDGGLVPKGNPDRMATRSNLIWAAYDLEDLFKDYEVVHAGYFNDYVLQDPDRLLPKDVMEDLVAEGRVGKLDNITYAMPACTTVSKKCAENGEEIAAAIVERGGVDGVILPST